MVQSQTMSRFSSFTFFLLATKVSESRESVVEMWWSALVQQSAPIRVKRAQRYRHFQGFHENLRQYFRDKKPQALGSVPTGNFLTFLNVGFKKKALYFAFLCSSPLVFAELRRR